MFGNAGWKNTPGMPHLDALDADARRRDREAAMNRRKPRGAGMRDQFSGTKTRQRSREKADAKDYKRGRGMYAT